VIEKNARPRRNVIFFDGTAQRTAGMPRPFPVAEMRESCRRDRKRGRTPVAVVSPSCIMHIIRKETAQTLRGTVTEEVHSSRLEVMHRYVVKVS